MSNHKNHMPDTADGQQEAVSGTVMDQEAEPESPAPVGPSTNDLPIREDTTAPRDAEQPKATSDQAEADPVGTADEQERSARKANTVFCVACGAEMNCGDTYCHSCGWDSRVSPTPPPQRLVDPNPSPCNRLAALLLCVILGFLGLHRFYVGKVGTGLLWLFTLGFLSVGVIFDVVLIVTGEFRDADQRRVLRWSDPQVG